jgi:hypothetical protein
VSTEHSEGKKLSAGLQSIYAPSTSVAMKFLEPVSKLGLSVVKYISYVNKLMNSFATEASPVRKFKDEEKGFDQDRYNSVVEKHPGNDSIPQIQIPQDARESVMLCNLLLESN